MALSYADILKRLLPRGAYCTEEGTAVSADIGVEGAGLDMAEGDILQLLDEIFADTAEELISAWENIYGIMPTETSAEGLALRRAKVLSVIASQPGLSRSAISSALAPLFGWPPIIAEYQLQSGDPPEYIYQWSAQQDGSHPISNFSQTAIMAAIDRVRPAHTQGHLTIAHPFLTDYAHSLTDNAANTPPNDYSLLRI